MTAAVSSRGFTVAVLDCRATVQVDDTALGDQLRALWRDCLVEETDGAGDGPEVRLGCSVGPPWVVTGPFGRRELLQRPEVVDAVCAGINVGCIERASMLSAHCGVVHRGGLTLVLPGVSGAGKTTLTAALLLRGWSYVSDEALALAPGGLDVVPYPRPLALSDWSTAALALRPGADARAVRGLDEWMVPASVLDASVARDPGRVTHVLLLDRRDGAGRPQLRPGGRADALQVLLRRGFTHHRDAAGAVTRTAALLRAADVMVLTYADPLAAADLVTAALRP